MQRINIRYSLGQMINFLAAFILTTTSLSGQWSTENNVLWGGGTYDILHPSNDNRSVSVGGPYVLQYKFSVRALEKQFAILKNVNGGGAIPVFVVDQGKAGVGDIPYSLPSVNAVDIDDKLHIFGRGRIQDISPYLNFEFGDTGGGEAGLRFLDYGAEFTSAPTASILLNQNSQNLTVDMPEDINFKFLNSTMLLDGFSLEMTNLHTRWKDASGNNRARLSFAGGNAVQFGNDINASVQLIQNSDPIITINTDQRVGVGIEDPLAKLHVKGDMRIEDGDGNLDFYNNVGTFLGYVRGRNDHMGIAFKDSADVRISTNGKFRVYVKGNGGVGIGRETPEQKLDVNGAIKLDNTNQDVEGSIRYSGEDFEGYDGDSWKSFTFNDSFWEEDVLGNLSTQRSVEIGRPEESSNLQLNGFMTFNNNENVINFSKPNAPVYFSRITADSANLSLIGFDETDLRFSTNAMLRMKINSQGNVTIGTLADVQKLSVDGAIKIGNTTNSAVGSIRYNNDDFEGYNGSQWKSFTSSGEESLWSENLDGDLYYDDQTNVGIGTSNPVAKLHVEGLIAVSEGIIHPSDVRLKENIESINNGLHIIRQLQPKKYHFKEKYINNMGLSERQQYGLLAQQVESVLPEIVHSNLKLDSDSDEEYKAIDYEQILPILIQAIQDLEKKVNQLEEQLEE